MTWKAIHPEDCVEYNALSRRPFEDLSCLLRQVSKQLSADDTTCTTLPARTLTLGSCANPAALGTIEKISRALQWILAKMAALLAASYRDWEFTLAQNFESLPHVPGRVIAATIVCSALVICIGRWNFIGQKPWAIRGAITLWNWIWCFVNLMGFLRLAPMVLHNFWHYSIKDNVCQPAASLWTSGTTGLWAHLWIYGKILEVLMESVLVVILKQPCGLMQWFHNYVYVLVHGWHLVTSEIPGGAACICIYYGIVAFMNAYCFYLNWRQLPQPTKPTAVLDAIHLIQTLSGVALSVTTLQYWKQAMWDYNNHVGMQYLTCAANEKHIRIMAFGWAGGHVFMACLNAMYQRILEFAKQEHLRELRLKKRKQEHARRKQARELLKQQRESQRALKKKKSGAKQKRVSFEEESKLSTSSDHPPSLADETDISNETNPDGHHDNNNNNTPTTNNNAATTTNGKEKQKQDVQGSSSSNHDSDATCITDNTATTVKRKNKKKQSQKRQDGSQASKTMPDGSPASSQPTTMPDESQASQATEATEQEEPPKQESEQKQSLDDSWQSSSSSCLLYTSDAADE